ncbi:Lrp/AsnC family transcriptional regulator [Acinetobacter gerneri]|jgi:DNA-binding Lrp family transcriptional regulator|uniref:Lrp/AsnC family transcriptional regulator n=1 Tax=Acinetobacter gerneri TaxID=202952 RepID=UPI0023F0EEC1|nr:Lrp/AsnC family transcriptional regulator [Acinetobacter gerneri]MCH4246008.1 Lrp/AsnC family transcriptional regulator [Acinetobacter gerneri]
MDNIDKKILAELQNDGRLSVTDLAEKIGLSVSPCHRRVKALEESGVIKGYRAELEPTLIGLNFSTIVFVTLKEANKTTISGFEDAIVDIAEVVQAQRLFGDPDYLLYVVSQDLEAFQKLYDRKLSAIPGVQRLTSTLVMKNVVLDRLFPL